MMHRIILKGADDCVFTMLSIIYDDIVNKIEKAKYTMEEGLETKDRDEAVQALDKLLNTKVKEEGGKLIVANDGSPLKNYIDKNKPLLNTLLFRREYTDRPQDKAFGPQKETKQLPSVDIQKLQFLIDNNINSLQDFKDKLKEMDYDSKFKVEREKQKNDGTTEKYMIINPKYFTQKTVLSPKLNNAEVKRITTSITDSINERFKNADSDFFEDINDKAFEKDTPNFDAMTRAQQNEYLRKLSVKSREIREKYDKIYDKHIKTLTNRVKRTSNREEKEEIGKLLKALKLYQRWEKGFREDSLEIKLSQVKRDKEKIEFLRNKKEKEIDNLNKKIREISEEVVEEKVTIFKPTFFKETEQFNKEFKLYNMFLDENGKPIKGLSKIIKDAPKRIKELQSAQRDVDSRTTDSLSLFLNSPALKGKGGSVRRKGRDTNYDILIYDLRKVLVLLLNAFGPEYKRQVSTMMEKIKDSLSNEMERLKDIKISDETARAIQQEGKLTDEMDSFYTELSKVLRELRSEKTVADFFKQKPFSKQRLIRMIMEDKDYLKYRIPTRKESDKLILLKDKMAEPSQIDDIKERLTQKNISKIVTILIKNKISPSELFTVKDKASVKSKFKKYTDDLSDIVENIETKFMSVNDVLDEEVEKLKKIFTIQEGARGKLISFGSDSDIPDISEYKTEINAIEGSLNSIKLEQLETLAQKLREKIKDHEGEKAAENANDFFTTSEKNLDDLKKVKVNLEKLVKVQEKMYNDFFEQWSKLVVEQKDKEGKDRLKSDLNIQRQLIVETKTKLYNASEKISGIERTLKALKQQSMFERFERMIVSRVARSDNKEFNRLNRAMKRIKRIMRAKEAPKGAEAKRNLRRGK